MIDRTIEPVFKDLVSKYPVVTITGPRQSGKTTLCRKVFPQLPYQNLEIPDVRQYALDNPRGFLNRYSEWKLFPDNIQAFDIDNGTATSSPVASLIMEICPLSSFCSCSFAFKSSMP